MPKISYLIISVVIGKGGFRIKYFAGSLDGSQIDWTRNPNLATIFGSINLVKNAYLEISPPETSGVQIVRVGSSDVWG